jgi:hypothetical protein
MNAKISCIVMIAVVLICCIYNAECITRSTSRLIGQQPLLFGRRGMNPNMNSLFFGKRSYETPTFEDVKDTCISIYNSCQKYIQSRIMEMSDSGEQ